MRWQKPPRLTHIRDNPPADFGEHASGWFEAVVEWLEAVPERSVRRLIAVRNEAMYLWAEQLQQVGSKIARFQVRVVTWTIDAPAINVAIIDDNVVFLAVTGEMLERTRGIAVEDTSVAHYFSDYYNNLWHCAQPLGEYLQDHSRPGAGRSTEAPRAKASGPAVDPF